jgi:hypothetical protein
MNKPAALAIVLGLAGCASDPALNALVISVGEGAAVGALMGAAVGGMGAGPGALAGAAAALTAATSLTPLASGLAIPQPPAVALMPSYYPRYPYP